MGTLYKSISTYVRPPKVGSGEKNLSTQLLVAVCGKSQLAVNALLTLHYLSLDSTFSLCVVPSRGDPERNSWQPSLRAAAVELGVPLVGIADISATRELVLLSLEFDQIIRTREYVSNRLFNIHFSALPSYRGVYTAIWPILNGEDHAGVTLHRMTEGIDDGPIIDQIVFSLDEFTTARSLYDRFLVQGQRLLARNLENILSNRIDEAPQADNGLRYYSRDSLQLPTDARLSLEEPSTSLVRKVRAFYFPEYQCATVLGRQVSSATVVGYGRAEPTGTILAETERYFVGVAGDRVAVQFVFAGGGA